MTTLDWAIVAFTVLLATYGYLQGFIVGALTLVGFVGGALLGGRLAPAVLHGGSHSPYAPLFGLGGALLLGSLLAAGLEGLGIVLRTHLRLPMLGVADGLLGGVLTACVALMLAWILSAVALQSLGAPALRTDIQRSAILRSLNSILPPSGPLLNALARFDPLPQLPGRVPIAPPSAAVLRAGPLRAAARSVVRVTGTACGLGVEGSGWVVAPGVVVTNAHVVAGESDTTVQLGGVGPRLSAQVIAFDVHNDIAVLHAPALSALPLTLAAVAPAGTAGAVIGYPENGPLVIGAARLGAEQPVLTQDAYGQGPVRREIVPLRARVRPGNSGGPVVDAHGQVVATVFAARVGPGPDAGFAVPDDVLRADLLHAQGPVGTGSCAS